MHPIKKLIHAFEDNDVFPVEPDDVRQWIVQHGFCDGFIVHYVDCDPQAFDGMYIERQGSEVLVQPAPYADFMRLREIFVNKRLPRERQRLAEVKESIHVLDSLIQRTNTPGDVNKMIGYAAKKVKLSANFGALTDALAFPQALAILFPWECRRLLKEAYDTGRLTADEIAPVAELPDAYVELVMSDDWEENYEFFLNANEGLEDPETDQDNEKLEGKDDTDKGAAE